MTLNITTDNAAFRDADCLSGGDCDTDECKTCREVEVAEVRRIMREVGVSLANGNSHGNCRDVNGNKVGQWSL